MKAEELKCQQPGLDTAPGCWACVWMSKVRARGCEQFRAKKRAALDTAIADVLEDIAEFYKPEAKR